MAQILSALILTFLVGCTATSAPHKEIKKGSAVKPSTNEMVKSCEYLDDLIGTSGWYGVFATQGVESARAEVLVKAQKIGATNVVWQSSNVSYGSTSVTGKVYRCNDY